MKIALALLALCFSLPAVPAFADSCLTPAQVRNGYNGCMQFLKLSVAKQKAVAAKTPYAYSQTVWACKLQKKKGLKQMLANERTYCNWLNRPSGGYSSSPYEDKAPLCSGSMDCHGGYCGASNSCTNGGNGSSCDNSMQCGSGYCGAGGQCS